MNVTGTPVKDICKEVEDAYKKWAEEYVARHDIMMFEGDNPKEKTERAVKASDITVKVESTIPKGQEDAIGYFIFWDQIPNYLSKINGVYRARREGSSPATDKALQEGAQNLKELFEILSKSIWTHEYSSDVDEENNTNESITGTEGPEFVVLETAEGADDKYTQVGTGSYSNDEKAYILTALENAYGETSEYGKKYSLNDMQTAYWLSLGQDPAEKNKGTANGRKLYENAQKYAEFVQQDFSASIDSSLAQVIADRKNQSYIVGPFSLDYPDYTAEDILSLIHI